MTRSIWPSPIEIRAMSVGMPEGIHPNKHHITGSLCKLDQVSDGSPFGADGQRIIITRAAAEAGLASLMGMGLNINVGLNGHSPVTKVGIITGGRIVGDELLIEGFLYAADFPREVGAIVAEQERLGLSVELRDLQVSHPSPDIMQINRCAFVGAAVLRKTLASYTSTSIAAARQDASFDRELREMLPALREALSAVVGSVVDRLDRVDRQLARLWRP